jgi:hypothetical protein
MNPTYAVLFKCHFWDGFTQRQLERVRRRTGSGEIFVVVDETGGSVPQIGHPEEHIVRISQAIAHDIGLEHVDGRPVFWYSNDYPLHVFTRRAPKRRRRFWAPATRSPRSPQRQLMPATVRG